MNLKTMSREALEARVVDLEARLAEVQKSLRQALNWFRDEQARSRMLEQRLQRLEGKV